jgi:hypothetical protein
MTTPPSPSSPSSGSGVSPDTLAQVQAQLDTAKIAERTARRTARLALVGVIIAPIITGVSIYLASHTSSANTAGQTDQLTLGPFGPPNGDSNIPWTISLSGPVSGLRGGQVVWTFNESLAEPRVYYPNTGPCSISTGTWTCPILHIGAKGRAGIGKYRIWAVVVSSSDAFKIVDELRCYTSGIPSIRGVTLNPECQSWTTSLPGGDLVPPQEIDVTRIR